MPKKKVKPRRLVDVSHLFISQNSKRYRKKETESVVWIYFPNAMFNRAYFAVGIAGGFNDQGGSVTIIETGNGLPNCGYYFALEPSEYLAPVLDRESIVSGESGDSIRYIYSIDAGNNKILRRKFSPPDFPHFILQAFSCPSPGPVREFRDVLKMISRSFSFSTLPNGLQPEVVIIVDDDSSRCSRLAALFREEDERIIILYVHPKGNRLCGDVDDNIFLSYRYLFGEQKRTPPLDSFFKGMASSIMQMISTHRKARY